MHLIWIAEEKNVEKGEDGIFWESRESQARKILKRNAHLEIS